LGRIEEIAEIHHKCLIEEFKTIGLEVDISLKHLEKKWKQNQDNIKTFTRGGKVIGFITTDSEPMIYVDPGYQRQGVGGKLLKISNVKSVWVMKGNEKAENFYKKNGFEPTESRKTTKLGHDLIETWWVKSAVD
jgi:GNAT superfamily N-acetyltransferase